jgi:hypothetical protein
MLWSYFLVGDGGQPMVRRRLGLALLSGATITVAVIGQVRPEAATQRDRVAWVAESLKRMQTVKPGMTRTDLLKVFTTEGGLSTGLHRTFVSRDCPYFKVDVEFKVVGRPDRDASGRVTLVEGNQDIIVKISRPYLQFSLMD